MSSQIRGPSRLGQINNYISNDTSTNDALPELQIAKSAFNDIKAQNQELKRNLELMQNQIQKIEDEKARTLELNDLKMQQFESKVKLMEIKAEREEQRRR